MGKFFLIVILLLVTTSSVTASPQEIHLGALLCLTGPCAADGQGTLNGMTLAVEKINKEGKFRVELTVEDSREETSVSAAVTAYRVLRAKNINIILGPSWSSAGEALAPIATKEKVLLVTPSLGLATFHRSGPLLFNARGVDANNSRRMARELYQQGVRSISIIGSQQTWELEQDREFRAEYENSGGKVLSIVEPLQSSLDLRAEVLKTFSARPPAIFFGGFTQLGLFARDLRKLGYTGVFYAAYIDATRVKESEGALRGAKFFGFPAMNQEFKEQYERRFGIDVVYPSALGHDTLQAVVSAIEVSSDTAPTQVAENLKKVSLSGVAGKLSFDEERCAVRETTMYVVSADDDIRETNDSLVKTIVPELEK